MSFESHEPAKLSYISNVHSSANRQGLTVLNHRRFYGDETERRKWQNPETILAAIGLKPGFTFIDVGCGEGFFAVPAAKIVGQKGRVFALDLDQDAITELKKKAAREDLKNLDAVVGGAEDTVFCEACADIVFFGIVLHDFSIPAKVLAYAKTMLKPAGRLVDLDWKKELTDFGPPLQIRFSEEQASSLIREAGFRIEQTKQAGPSHYIIIATHRA
ncbi:MAG TPA: class I SAM-dependent methyltransferase [Candidatus Acidoferrales bacterium]|nr:class I SAM-dependent methyltransferase [Candidatus Acidoferrales bacterium]